MKKVKITYYEGVLKRTLEVNKAKKEGRECFRPWGFRGIDAAYPIVPRSGDHIYFHVHPEHASHFPLAMDKEGKVKIGAEVKFVELNDGSENIFIHCTDPGCGPYGAASDEDKRTIEAAVGGPVDWK